MFFYIFKLDHFLKKQFLGAIRVLEGKMLQTQKENSGWQPSLPCNNGGHKDKRKDSIKAEMTE